MTCHPAPSLTPMVLYSSHTLLDQKSYYYVIIKCVLPPNASNSVCREGSTEDSLGELTRRDGKEGSGMCQRAVGLDPIVVS